MLSFRLLSPRCISSCVLSQPQNEVPEFSFSNETMQQNYFAVQTWVEHSQVLGSGFYKQQPLLKVLQTQRRQMLSVQNIFQPNVKSGYDAPRRQLPFRRRWMGQSPLMNTPIVSTTFFLYVSWRSRTSKIARDSNETHAGVQVSRFRQVKQARQYWKQ